MIVYEDAQVLVCRKPAGVTSEEGGLPELLKASCGARRLYCVHRLDRETTGLMVYAKTAEAAAALSAAIAAGEMHKEYLAVVEGETPERGEMRDLLYHDRTRNKSFVVDRQRRGVREAALLYETLGRKDGLSLVRVSLLTGRSHQIRVQFASRGHPLAGDRRYGSRGGGPFCLHACTLAFPHPLTGRTMRFSDAPAPVGLWRTFSLSSGQFPPHSVQ